MASPNPEPDQLTKPANHNPSPDQITKLVIIPVTLVINYYFYSVSTTPKVRL